MYRRLIKRPLDIVLSFMGLAILAIPMVIIAIVIKLESKGPAVFRQVRLGKHEKPFTIYKFRTMCDHAYEQGGLVSRSDDPRITKVGAFLRRSSLDELLQLINIIRGDMSIIGPRPILPWEFDGYRENPKYRKRHDVRPGLFCTVDIEFRATADREMQFAMDAEYVEHINFLSDCRIFFRIFGSVLSRKNIYRDMA